MQQREHHVDGAKANGAKVGGTAVGGAGARRDRHPVERYQAAHGGVTWQHHRPGGGVDRGQHAVADGERVRIVRAEYPSAIGGDTDSDNVITPPVQGSQDAASRDTGDRVLGAAAAVQDGDPGPARRRARHDGTLTDARPRPAEPHSEST